MKTTFVAVMLLFGSSQLSIADESADIETLARGYGVALAGSEECDEVRSLPDAGEKLEKMGLILAYHGVKAGISVDEMENLVRNAGFDGFLVVRLDRDRACQMAMTLFEAVE